jgi:hypothetical protein
MPRRPSVRRTGPPTCRDCGARVVFVRMVATDRQMPVDPIPVADGNVCARRIGNRLHGYVISEDKPANPSMERYAAHFGTCQDRQDRREPKPAPPEPPALFDLPKE